MKQNQFIPRNQKEGKMFGDGCEQIGRFMQKAQTLSFDYFYFLKWNKKKGYILQEGRRKSVGG